MNDIGLILIQGAVGLTMIAFGLNQLKNPDAWMGYVPTFLEKLLPTALSRTFMRIHASVNVGLGVLFAVGVWPAVIAWLTIIWWLSILPFALKYNWKIGMRDFAIVAAVLAVALTING